MRKIERQMNSALQRKANWPSSNTTVQYNEFNKLFFGLLHGHQIATQIITQMHLNCLPVDGNSYYKITFKCLLDEFKYGCKVFQKNFDWYS